MGKKSSKQTTNNQPWQPLQQPIINAVNQTSGVVSANQQYDDQLGATLRGQLPQLQQMAFGAQPGLTNGLNYANDVLGGKYLGQGNPYLNNMIAQTDNSVANGVQSRFGLAGRTGSGANVGALTKGLANAENGLRYQDYSAERDRMAQQQGMLPSLINAQYAGISPYLGLAQASAEAPYTGISHLGQIIGLGQGAGTSTTTQRQPWGPMVMNALAAGAQAAASDRRLKTDIVDHGNGLYDWTYRQDMGLKLPEGRYRGVMADEVAPEFLGPTLPGGFQTVLYTPERIG